VNFSLSGEAIINKKRLAVLCVLVASTVTVDLPFPDNVCYGSNLFFL
jgi:hypothetical protein